MSTNCKYPVSVALVGAGARGKGYTNYALDHPDELRVVAVAEPIAERRKCMRDAHAILPENIFSDWRELAARERLADAVIIATQDAMHVEPAVALARKGYHMLLEKPIAPTIEGCREVLNAVKKAGIHFAVCHVLRYTPHHTAMRELLASGALGEIISIQHLEPVGYWHQAHSYVRGHWRNEAESTSMLMAKSCHDLDLIRDMMEGECLAVSSFGSLTHFTPENRPEGASGRCMDCAVESTCPYSAKKFYLGRVAEGNLGWPTTALAHEVNEQTITEALKTGQWGRCVYACDNDAVDHQVVAMEFERGKTVSFTMTGFTFYDHRQTRLFGTRGEAVGNGETITVNDFLTGESRVIDAGASDPSLRGGHGGGDIKMMEAFTRAIAEDDPSYIRSGAEESLESHLMAFAAERSRKERRVVPMAELAEVESAR